MASSTALAQSLRPAWEALSDDGDVDGEREDDDDDYDDDDDWVGGWE